VIYIFSQMLQKKGDEEDVAKLREYANKISGFKNVVVVERKTNSRICNSTEAQKFLLEKYGKMIFMEDDTLTNKYFLQFMNEMLDIYEHDKNIFCICGYSPDIKYPAWYEHGYFLSKRISPWGFAIWKDRGSIEAITNYDIYLDILNDLPSLIRGYKIIRKTVTHSLRVVYMNRELRGDAMMFARQLKNRQFSIIPRKSFVKNIGLDNSGLHCGTQVEYATSSEYHQSMIELVNNIEYNKKIDSIYCDFYNKPKNISQRKNQIKSLVIIIIDLIKLRLFKKIN